MAIRRAVFTMSISTVLLAGGLLVPAVLQNAAAATPNPAPIAGSRKSATQLHYGLSATASASVDVATGNVLVTDQLFTLPGVTASVPVAIAWNSSVVGSSIPSAVTGGTGSGWGITGFDQRLTSNADNSVTYDGPSGLTGVFALKSGSTTAYTAPPQYQADLTKTSTGWTLKQHGAQSTLSFNTSGRLTQVSDRNQNLTTFNYDPYGYPQSIVTSRGATATRTLKITTSGSKITKLTQTSSTSSTTTRSVTLGYSSQGNLASVTDTAGKVTTFASDSAGYTDTAQVAFVTNPAGATTTIGYSGTKATRIAQSNGTAGSSVTRLSYPTSSQTLVADPTTDQAAAVSAVPHTTYNLTTNGSMLVADASDPDGHKQSATYTSLGTVATSTPASGGATTFTYGANAGESLTSAATDAGAKSTASFGGSGASQYSPSSATADSGNALKFTYNGAGNQMTTAAGTGPSANVDYNTDGTPSTSASPGAAAGVKTTYGYDATHQPTTITPVSGSTLTARNYTWDGFGRLATATDGRGNTITYSYDNADRITKVDYSDAGTADAAYTFDSLGRVTQRVDGSGTTTYSYDSLGHLLTTANTAGGGTISYGYDLAGALTSESDARGTTTYAYDPAHRLTSMTYPAPKNGAGATQSAYFANDANGRRTDTWLTSNAAHSAWSAHSATTYDSSGRVTHVVSQRGPATGPTTVTDLTYCYASGTTPAGGCTATTTSDRAKIQWVKDAVSSENTVYAYDGTGSGGTQTGRLTSVAITGSSNPRSYTYTYDAAGNRLTAKVSGTSPSSQTETVNAANQLTTANYTYDAAGNLTKDGATGATYSYNTAGQRIRATTNRSTSSGTVTDTTTYTYGGTNNDELLKQSTTNGDTYTYAYGRADQNGLPQIEEVTLTVSAGTTYQAYVAHDPTGAPVMIQTSTGTTAMYVYDGRGNPIGLTTDFNATAYMLSFDPYGAATVTENSGGTGLPQNPYVYGGGLQDRATGLVKYGQRWYDTRTGRWIQQDGLNAPLSPSTANRYGYAGGDPINASDPTGELSFELSGQVCAFGGCLKAGVGIDDDGDVQVSGGVGTGVGGDVGAELDPDGDYTDGGSVSESVGCNVGPYNVSASTSDGSSVDVNQTIGTSVGAGCSASVTGSYTF